MQFTNTPAGREAARRLFQPTATERRQTRLRSVLPQTWHARLGILEPPLPPADPTRYYQVPARGVHEDQRVLGPNKRQQVAGVVLDVILRPVSLFTGRIIVKKPLTY